MATRLVVANLFAVRSVAIEFGPAELIDSIAIRPLAYYFGPMIFGNVAAGWIFGKLLSDIGFYALAIFSYERFNGLLAGRRQQPRRSAVNPSLRSQCVTRCERDPRPRAGAR